MGWMARRDGRGVLGRDAVAADVVAAVAAAVAADVVDAVAADVVAAVAEAV